MARSNKAIFHREAVLKAALDVVKSLGWDALTAHAVAGRLGASVGPVYLAFGSMGNLSREVLMEIRRLLGESLSQHRRRRRLLRPRRTPVF